MGDDDPVAAWLRDRDERQGREAGPTAGTDGEPPWPDTEVEREWPQPPADADASWLGVEAAAAGDERLTASTTLDDVAGDAAPRRRWWLLAAGTVPWLLAAVLAVALVHPSAPAPAAAPHPSGVQPAAPHPSAPEGGAATPGGVGVAAGGERPAEARLVEAAAALAVRTGVTSSGGGRARYVDLATPAGVTWLGDVAVVTVEAVVLDGARGAWDAARTARYGVALRLVDGTAVAVSPPWPLPVPRPPRPAPAWQAVDDPRLAAGAAAAIGAAGYREVGELALARDPHVPDALRARAVAVAPGESRRRQHELWLRDGPVTAVLGAEPRRATR